MQAHNGFVRGMTCSHDGNTLLTIGDDRTIKHWSTNALDDDSNKPLNTIVTKVSLWFINIKETHDQYSFRLTFTKIRFSTL